MPVYRTQDYTETTARVTRASTIDVRRVTYSVPSSLIGHHLRIRLYDNRLCCYLGTQHIISLERVYLRQTAKQGHHINYRHVIASLIKKPHAFRYCRWRDALLPTEAYRTIWRYVEENLPARAACPFIVGILHIAATHDCELQLAEKILQDIAQQTLQSLSHYQMAFKTPQHIPPLVPITKQSLTSYNLLLTSNTEAAYVV